METVNLEQAFRSFQEYWCPKVVAELNGQHVMVVKVKGEFVWHHHDHEDELFLVVKGVLEIQFRDHVAKLREGEFLVVPHGVEHRPVAVDEVHLLLFEPVATLNTGNVRSERTVAQPETLHTSTRTRQ
jgi:mannose-6-phosphate isomerase-like protein (cupin superfamily)